MMSAPSENLWTRLRRSLTDQPMLLPPWLRMSIAAAWVVSNVGDLRWSNLPLSANLLLVVSTVAVVLALRWPTWGGALGLVVLFLTTWEGNGWYFTLDALLLAVIVVATCPVARAIPLLLGMAGWTILSGLAEPDDMGIMVGATLPVMLFVAGAVGVVRHLVAQRFRDQRRMEELQQSLAQARLGERRHLAGELHDIVAHSITMNVMLASMGPSLKNREEMTAAFERIEESSRSVLADLRRLFGVLERSDPTVSVGLATVDFPLDEQIEQAGDELRDLGFDVTTSVNGPVETVPTSLEHSLSRSLKEMVTNVAKYAAPGFAVDLRLDVTEHTVALRIANTVATRVDHSLSGGVGLVHMQEQADALGGHLDISRTADHWSLELALPLRVEPTTELAK